MSALVKEVQKIAGVVFLIFIFGSLVFATPYGPNGLECHPLNSSSDGISTDALAFVNSSLGKFKKNACGCEVGGDSKPIFSEVLFPPVPRIRLSAAQCLPPDSGALCKAATSECITYSGEPNAFWALIGCPDKTSISDENINQLGRKKIKYAVQKFYSITQDPKKQLHCCGNNLFCQKKFSQTKLQILTGLGDSDQTAQDLGLPPHFVQISNSTIANCVTQDCVDRIIFHELGHACHRWQWETRGHSPGIPGYINTSNDLVHYLGTEGAACVMKGLNSYRQGAKANFQKFIDFDEWAEEAFANTVFIGEWGTAGLGWDCFVTEDAQHCDPKAYMGCFLSLPEFRSKFCKE